MALYEEFYIYRPDLVPKCGCIIRRLYAAGTFVRKIIPYISVKARYVFNLASSIVFSMWRVLSTALGAVWPFAHNLLGKLSLPHASHRSAPLYLSFPSPRDSGLQRRWRRRRWRRVVRPDNHPYFLLLFVSTKERKTTHYCLQLS